MPHSGHTATRPTAHTPILTPDPATQPGADPTPAHEPPARSDPDPVAAIDIANRAQFDPPPQGQGIDVTLVHCCADVTAECHRRGLLTEGQFIVYLAFIPGNPGKIKMSETETWVEGVSGEPVVYEGLKPIQRRPASQVKRDIQIPANLGLREKFLRLAQDKSHPLHYTPPPRFPENYKSPV